MLMLNEEEENHPFGFGVKFRPTDVECVLYLMCKIVGDPLPREGVVLDSVNPYDETQLPALFTAAQNRDLFFFTTLKKKGSRAGNFKNADRTVGNNKATWHGGQSWDVTYSRFGVIGTAHTFSYRENGSSNDRRFLITEYHLPLNTTLRYDPLKHQVLCRLRVNNPNRSKRRCSHQPQVGNPSTKKLKSCDHVTPTNQPPSPSSSTSSDTLANIFSRRDKFGITFEEIEKIIAEDMPANQSQVQPISAALTTNQAASSSTFHHQLPTTMTTTTTTPAAADENSNSWTWGIPSFSTPDIADNDTFSLGNVEDESLVFTREEMEMIFSTPDIADNDTFSVGNVEDEPLGLTLEEMEKILAEDDIPANQSAATPANSFSWITASEFPSSSVTPSGAFNSCESQVQPISAASSKDMYYDRRFQLSADDSSHNLRSEELKVVTMVDGVPF